MTSKQTLVSAISVLVGLAVGAISGALISQNIALHNDFPRTMQLRAMVIASMDNTSPQEITLQLLDLYENGIRRQTSSLDPGKLDWQNELMEVNLRRYIVRRTEQQENLAEQAIIAAATIRKKGQAPTAEDIEFCKQLANRVYASKK